MKRIFKKILIVLFIIFVIIQFIRPAKNNSTGPFPNDITTKYNIPDTLKKILVASCYDCHSNNTAYPWYAEIQPVGWWLSSHIKDGKRGLNFSEFTRYKIRKQFIRMDDINELVKKDEMPLSSYLIIHQYAKLNEQQKLMIANWTNEVRAQIKANYPPDSLLKK